jgi:hypothetical protein
LTKTLSTAAWVAHDLGLAAGVGGSVFGRLAMHPAVKKISSEEERGMIVADAWQKFNTVQLPALGVMAATWFIGRTALSGREVDRGSRWLVILKDAFVVGTLGTGIGAAITGRRLAAQRPGGGVPMGPEGEVAPSAPAKAKRLQRAVDSLGIANLVCGAGVVALTAVLAMRAGRSGTWSLVSRFLP